MGSKPAPIIINYLGFPASSFLPEYDYRITDKYVDPDIDKNEYTEEILYIKDCPFVCHQFFDIIDIPEINPKLKRNEVIIGTVSRLGKHIYLKPFWKKLLDKYPYVKLLIKFDYKSENNEIFN
jgi:predicted O-linked N-acetylglucosamine transferase (SPINDLY family)